ncbi:MAG: hypothetical protein ACJ73S_22865 [Mycobacteriales bacterium]
MLTQYVVPAPIVSQLRLVTVASAIELGGHHGFLPRQIKPEVSVRRRQAHRVLQLRCRQTGVQDPQAHPTLHRRLRPPVAERHQSPGLHNPTQTRMSFQLVGESERIGFTRSQGGVHHRKRVERRKHAAQIHNRADWRSDRNSLMENHILRPQLYSMDPQAVMTSSVGAWRPEQVNQTVVNNPEPMKAGGGIPADDQPRRYQQARGADHLKQRRRLMAIREHAAKKT